MQWKIFLLSTFGNVFKLLKQCHGAYFKGLYLQIGNRYQRKNSTIKTHMTWSIYRRVLKKIEKTKGLIPPTFWFLAKMTVFWPNWVLSKARISRYRGDIPQVLYMVRILLIRATQRRKKFWSRISLNFLHVRNFCSVK